MSELTNEELQRMIGPGNSLISPELLKYYCKQKVGYGMSIPQSGYYLISEYDLKPSEFNPNVLVPIASKFKYKEKPDELFCELNTPLKLKPLFNRYSKYPTISYESILNKVIHIESVMLIHDPEYDSKTYVVNWCFSQVD